jgi:glucose/arabinose dehydrogenase/cytochrome c5
MYGVILDRKFASNHTIYFAWHTRMAGDAAPMGRVASAKLAKDEKSVTDVKVLLEGADIQPRGLIQGKDGKLYVFSADVSDTGVNSQNMMNQFGKVLRINTDGTIPKDNPFIGRADVAPTVWANGYRDIHSAIIHPRTGEIWAVENVPKGGDEIDIYRKGRNYGFGVATYGRQNSGAMINDGKTAQDGIEQPLYYWNPSIAPAGMLLYTGGKFPAWRNDIFVGGMSGMQVARLVMKDDKVVGEEKLLMDRCERIKAIEQGPDGYIYILTDQMPTYQNEILRLVPAPTPPAPKMPEPGAPIPIPQPGPGERPRVVPAAAAAATPDEFALGAAVFGRSCATCHGAQGEGGAGPRLAGRTDTAYIATAVREGAGAMPALAGTLSPAEIDAVSKYVAHLPR